MQVLGIAGSMRKKGATARLVRRVLDEMEQMDETVSAEFVQVSEHVIQPCRVTCSAYCCSHPYQCSIDDETAGILARMVQADALVIGAPLYFRAPPAHFQALLERLVSMFFFYESQGEASVPSPLAGKLCGLVGVAEYSNPQQILETLHDFCLVLKMRPVRLSHFPYLGVAGQGDIEADQVFDPYLRAKELAVTLLAV